MTEKTIEQLKEASGIEHLDYLIGKPREYYCEEHGVLFSCIVHDPYDIPVFVCPDCGEQPEYRKVTEE
jgi:hypothetical protein